jgi:TMEM175 potassium channel family protein
VPAVAEPVRGGLAKARTETLADGVFAIAMTLLVLEITVPPHEKSLHDALPELAPHFLAYVLSFAYLGVYWVGHHAQFESIRRVDRPLLWIGLGFLLFITLIPFSSALLADRHDEPLAVAFYGCNIAIAGLFLEANWAYATHRHRLVDPDMPADIIRIAAVRILFGAFGASVAVALAVVDTRWSLVVFALIPPLYVVPGRVDRFWRRGGR